MKTGALTIDITKRQTEDINAIKITSSQHYWSSAHTHHKWPKSSHLKSLTWKAIYQLCHLFWLPQHCKWIMDSKINHNFNSQSQASISVAVCYPSTPVTDIAIFSGYLLLNLWPDWHLTKQKNLKLFFSKGLPSSFGSAAKVETIFLL